MAAPILTDDWPSELLWLFLLSSHLVKYPMSCFFRSLAPLVLLVTPMTIAMADELPGLAAVKRIVFLGDSITYSGQYIEIIDAYLAARAREQPYELIDLGLPSETVSGLSEPGHAGDKFPRPDLHERLQRVLAKTKPDMVVACYGMNCGIYHPFDQERFEKFQSGITRLHEQVEKAGAKLVHVTPPTFDLQPIKDRTLPAGLREYRQPYEGYNEVLDRYSEWLLTQCEKGWDVVDLHGPMNQHLAVQRQNDPQFTMARDGVHMNAAGHWLAAQQILLHWGAPTKEVSNTKSADELLQHFPHGEAVYKLAQQRQRLLKDAWLTEVGHLRPGMKPGLPLASVEQQVAELTQHISTLVTK